jgi:glycosyltransferase involved in cell wall biosynthesis
MDLVPQISVIMPVYNAELYLYEAIESILQQSFGNFELLLINDGSTDSSLQIIQQIKDNRIRILNNDYNMGLIYSLNWGIAEARGKYIARMDADDICLPDRFKKQFEYMELKRLL